MPSKKIVFIKPVFRAGGMKLPTATVTPFVPTYVSPAAITKAADVGAKAFIRAITKDPSMSAREAADVAFWATDRAINRYSKDPSMSVNCRAQFRVTDRNAGIFGDQPPCGQDEYFNPIPDGYSTPFLGGRDWLWPALLRLGWVVPVKVRKAMKEQQKWELDIAKKSSYPKETRDDSAESAKVIGQLLAT